MLCANLCFCVWTEDEEDETLEERDGEGGGLSLDLIPAKRTVCFTADDPGV